MLHISSQCSCFI